MQSCVIYSSKISGAETVLLLTWANVKNHPPKLTCLSFATNLYTHDLHILRYIS